MIQSFLLVNYCVTCSQILLYSNISCSFNIRRFTGFIHSCINSSTFLLSIGLHVDNRQTTVNKILNRVTHLNHPTFSRFFHNLWLNHSLSYNFVMCLFDSIKMRRKYKSISLTVGQSRVSLLSILSECRHGIIHLRSRLEHFPSNYGGWFPHTVL